MNIEGGHYTINISLGDKRYIWINSYMQMVELQVIDGNGSTKTFLEPEEARKLAEHLLKSADMVDVLKTYRREGD